MLYYYLYYKLHGLFSWLFNYFIGLDYKHRGATLSHNHYSSNGTINKELNTYYNSSVSLFGVYKQNCKDDVGAYNREVHESAKLNFGEIIGREI